MGRVRRASGVRGTGGFATMGEPEEYDSASLKSKRPTTNIPSPRPSTKFECHFPTIGISVPISMIGAQDLAVHYFHKFLSSSCSCWRKGRRKISAPRYRFLYATEIHSPFSIHAYRYSVCFWMSYVSYMFSVFPFAVLCPYQATKPNWVASNESV